MKSTHQIINFSWQGKDKNLSPVCRIRDLNSYVETDIQLNLPYQFNWQLSTGSFCPGYWDESGDMQICPDQAVIDDKYDRCKHCEKKDGFRAAFFYGDISNERMQRHMDREHFIYLACFFPDIIKVGTVVSSRKYKRLIEQDALFAYIIASAPGHMIQRLEGDIANYLNLTRSVTTRRKTGGMFTKLNTSRFQKFLHSNLSRLQNHQDLKKYLLSKPELVDFTEHPEIYYPDSQVFSIDKPLNLAGKFLGLRGRQLLIQTEHGTVSHKTTNIINKQFVHAEQPIKPENKAIAQQSLF